MPQQTIEELGRLQPTYETVEQEAELEQEPELDVTGPDADEPTGKVAEADAFDEEEDRKGEVMTSRPLSLEQLRRAPLDSLTAVEDFELEVSIASFPHFYPPYPSSSDFP